jgi:restriction endonuclease Mrr
MSVRIFQDVVTDENHLKKLQVYWCPFCKSELKSLGQIDKSDPIHKDRFPDYTNIRVCNFCGWWVVSRYNAERYGGEKNNAAFEDSRHWYSSIAGKLKEMDVTDVSIPIDELSRQLIIKRQSRFTVNPQRFEDLVSQLLKDFGFDIIATSYGGNKVKGRGDEGLDVIVLNSSKNEIIGVQVKRTVNRIEAEQIRSIFGALILKGITKGIFVTTSAYTRGANATSIKAELRGVPIELWDGDKFLDKLKISLRPMYNTIDDTNAPFYPYIQGKKELITYDFKDHFEVYD